MRDYNYLKYKHLLAILLLVLGVSINVNGQIKWRKLNTNSNASLRRVTVVDSNLIIAVGDSGAILRSQNKGLSWSRINSGTNANLTGIAFTSKTKGFIVGWSLQFATPGSIILKTTDAGVSWSQSTFSEPFIFLSNITFSDSLHGAIVGSSQKVYVTQDGGDNWVESAFDGSISGFSLTGVTFYNNEYGFVSGGQFDVAGLIFRTTDGGRGFSGNIVSPEPVQAVTFIDSSNVIGIGGDFEFGTMIANTTNGGNSWSYKSLEVYGIGYKIEFRTPTEWWAPLGFAQQLLYTTDAGTSWKVTPVPDSMAIYSIKFLNRYTGYAAGLNGTVLQYDSLYTSVEDRVKEESNISRISSVYPNPIRSNGNLVYDVVREGGVTIKLYDILGSECGTLVDEIKGAGSYIAGIEGNKFRSGVYFARMVTSEKGKPAEAGKPVKIIILK